MGFSDFDRWLLKKFGAAPPRGPDLSVANFRAKLEFILDPEKRVSTKKIAWLVLSLFMQGIKLTIAIALILVFSHYFYTASLTDKNQSAWWLLIKIIGFGIVDIMLFAAFVLPTWLGAIDKYRRLKEFIKNRHKPDFEGNSRKEDEQYREDQGEHW